MTQTMYGDASGRGAVSGYRVSIPARQHPYTEEEIAAVVNVMRNVDGQTQGTYLAKFQEDFAAFTGAKHAFAVDNATNALSLAATLCGIRPGDEVITAHRWVLPAPLCPVIMYHSPAAWAR